MTTLMSFVYHGKLDDRFIKLHAGNHTVVGRRLLLSDGEYFTGLRYGVAARFQRARFRNLTSGHYVRWWPGCPNAYDSQSAENCHTLNIYRCTRREWSGVLLPVFVYFHGGDWYSKNDANLDPAAVIENVACKGAVVVSVNYRMGPFAYFTTHDAILRGNLALYDMKLALEWIRDNIGYFGGHRRLISVVSTGLGASLASVLSMDPSIENKNFSEGFVRTQIFLGGSAFIPTLIQPTLPKKLANATQIYDPSEFSVLLLRFSSLFPGMHFAIAANCTTAEQWRNKTQQKSRVIFACLRRIHRDNISVLVSEISSSAFVAWPLIPDGDLVKPLNWRTFNDAPNIPTILGTCRHHLIASNDTDARADAADDLRHLSYGDEVVRHYRREMALNDDHGGLIDFMRYDYMQNGPMTIEAEQRSRKVNASVYMLEYEFPPNTTRETFGVEIKNVSSSLSEARLPPCVDDLLFTRLEPDSELYPSIQTLSSLLRNFAALANPDGKAPTSRSLPSWPTFSSSTRQRLKFSTIGVELASQDAASPATKFWLCDVARKMFLWRPPLCG